MIQDLRWIKRQEILSTNPIDNSTLSRTIKVLQYRDKDSNAWLDIAWFDVPTFEEPEK